MKKLNDRFPGQKFRIQAFLLVTALILSVTSGVVFARYVLKEDHSGLAEAESFYFESNYLKEGGAEYTVYTGSVDITITNSDGLNTTPEMITYTTTGMNANGQNQILGGDTQNINTYTVSGIDGDAINVSATSSSPYARTLSAIFSFKNPGENTVYEIKDQGYYITLDIYTGMNTQNITVNYGNDLAPDNTNEKIKDWVTGSAGTLSGLSPNAHYSLIFFKNNSMDYAQIGQQILGADNAIDITVGN